jgi:hypothetical protein
MWLSGKDITNKPQLFQYYERLGMRSDIVFEALQTKNRFVLCHEAFKAVRLLHKSNTRIEDTTNEALMRIAAVEPNLIVTQEDVVAPAVES